MTFDPGGKCHVHGNKSIHGCQLVMIDTSLIANITYPQQANQVD